MHKQLCLTVLLLGLTACQTTQPVPPAAAVVIPLPAWPDAYFPASGSIPTPGQLFTLTAEQQADFDSYMQSDHQAGYPPEERIYNYMQNLLVAFNFAGETLSASEVSRTANGNCVSLAILTYALAKQARVEVSFRVTFREPVLDIRQDLWLTANHVRSYLHSATVPGAAVGIDYFSDRLDYLGPTLSEPGFLAMVYNNLAAEALLRKDIGLAYQLTRRALQFDPAFAASINMMAVLLRRQHQPALAAQWYDYGLQVMPANLTMLANYQLLAETQQDQTKLQWLAAQMAKSESPDPFAWYLQAASEEKAGRVPQAIAAYQKTLQQAPYLMPANRALANLYLHTGQPALAENTLQQALQYSSGDDNRQLLMAKLKMLRQLAERP